MIWIGFWRSFGGLKVEGEQLYFWDELGWKEENRKFTNRNLKVKYFIILDNEIKDLSSYLKENCLTFDETDKEYVFLDGPFLINKVINFYKVTLIFYPFNEYETLKRIYENFNNNLTEDNKFKKVVKFYDDFHLNDLSKYQKEIFKIEMSLRQIFTFIFSHRYKDTENLLFEYKFNKENKTNLENEFFQLDFNDYIDPNSKLKNLESKDILNILFNSDNFEKFKENLQERGIREEKHKDFILSIKEDLQAIKDVRNNIAHNKKIFTDDKQEQNYCKARDEIEKKD